MQRELARGMVAVGRLRLHARLEPGVAGQPEPAAAERGRQQRARARCRTRTSASSSGARRTASRTTRASTSASRSASRAATRSASSYTLGDSKDNASEQLTTQGSNAFPQNARDFDAVVRAERLRRPPPLHRELRRGTCRSARTSSRATGRVSGIYARALGPAVHRQPEQQQRRHRT